MNFPQPGRTLKHYRIINKIGQGGMGEVYSAEDTTLGRRVALKLLPREHTQDEERLRRFRQEAKAASALNHPNILTIHEIGHAEATHFITTEFIEGETLRQHIKSAHMKLSEALNVAIQTADALSAAHEAGIIHRDIKPENIMLRQRDAYVKVLDFGLAKLIEQPPATVDTEAPTKALFKTAEGIVVGTVIYMSPEQARGLAVDARTDIWSLGVVLYEMVAGCLPFEGSTTSEVLASILNEKEPPPLARFAREVPAELERIVEKALRKDREERYQSAKDMLLDLKRLKHKLEVEAEIERTVPPELRSAPGAAKPSGGQETVSTAQASSAQTATVESARTTSSVEYIITEIKRHKHSALLALAALVAVTAAVAYFAYSRYAGGGRAGTIRSIAVLPFANTGGNPDAEYLSDGISESLINSLSQLPGVKVIARSSSFNYKGKEVDPQEVARALGVQAIVMGRIAQRGDSLQISVELVNARDKTQMWGGQYTRKAADIQAVQEEIARAISEKLRLRLTGAQEQQLTKHATQNPQAYQLYLNGLFYLRKGGFENVRKALDYFNQAVALDPNFALAWAAVARAHLAFAGNSLLDPKESLARAKQAAQKALQLDETLAEAHLSLARIKQNEWDWAGAEREYKRAVELNPNLAEAHFRYSDYLSITARHTEAWAELKREQELGPLQDNLRIREADALFSARRYDEAIEMLTNAIKLEPDSVGAHFSLGLTYAAKGMYEQAINELRKAISIQGETTTGQCYLGYALAMSGKRSEAQAILDKLKMTKEYVSPTELAVLYVGMGDKEGAIASLERAYAAHDLQLQNLKIDPGLDSLRSDPRFADLLRRVGLPQ